MRGRRGPAPPVMTINKTEGRAGFVRGATPRHGSECSVALRPARQGRQTSLPQARRRRRERLCSGYPSATRPSSRHCVRRPLRRIHPRLFTQIYQSAAFASKIRSQQGRAQAPLRGAASHHHDVSAAVLNVPPVPPAPDMSPGSRPSFSPRPRLPLSRVSRLEPPRPRRPLAA